MIRHLFILLLLRINLAVKHFHKQSNLPIGSDANMCTTQKQRGVCE